MNKQVNGESITFSWFYQDRDVIETINRLATEFERKHGQVPTEGLLQSKYATALNAALKASGLTIEVLPCDGIVFGGIHFHFASAIWVAPYTEMVLSNKQANLLHGV
jgi:ABC-type glycerol-3-phosphate transport system substrate-binding protein